MKVERWQALQPLRRAAGRCRTPPARAAATPAGAVAALAALAAAAAVAAWACGPFFPNWLLGKDELVMQGPTARFSDEVRALFPPGSAGPRAVPAGDRLTYDPVSQTAAIDRQEVAEVLRASGMPEDRQRQLTAAYGKVRDALLARATAAASVAAPSDNAVTGNGEPWPASAAPAPSAVSAPATGPAAVAHPAPSAALPAVPAGLPAEIARYLEGAIAYRVGDDARARRAWAEVMALPARQRQHRSTWAAFMLGRLAMRGKDPEAAVAAFRQTRQLAQQGFADRLGLAAASLGWEGQVELQGKRYVQAITLYAAQQRTGDPTAETSLRFACRAALEAGGATLAALARDGVGRAAMTSFVLAQQIDSNLPADAPPTPPEAAAWMAAVRAARVTEVAGADRLAWAAYRAGDFGDAAGWVERAADSPVRRWVRARLLLRAGKLAEAEPLLAGIGALPPEAAIVRNETAVPPHEAVAWIGDPYLATPARALGEAGVAALSLGRMETALDHLLRAGYWLDAAYVAERVLSLQELQAYVDQAWPARLADETAPPPGSEGWEPYWSTLDAQEAPPQVKLANEIRYLLARRLVREAGAAGMERAAPYLPAALRPRLARLAAALAAGADPARPAGQRAASLFTAACLTRYQGMLLQGTEIDPDWRLFQGNFTADELVADRDRRPHNAALKATAAETERAAQHRASPWKRFHYRYRAADLARTASALLPADSAERAGMLVTAGQWLAVRDPEAARPFYQSLMSCCGATDLGRAAARGRWLPKADICDPSTEQAPPKGSADAD